MNSIPEPFLKYEFIKNMNKMHLQICIHCRKLSRSRKPSTLADIKENNIIKDEHEEVSSSIQKKEKDIDQRQFEIFEKELKQLYNKIESKQDQHIIKSEAIEIRQNIEKHAPSLQSTITLLIKENIIQIRNLTY